MIGGGEVHLGHVVHAVGLGAVAAHVVDDAAGGDDEAVAALLDALDVAVGPVRRGAGSPSTSTATARHMPRRSGAPSTSGSVHVASTGAGMSPVHPPAGVWATGMASAVTGGDASSVAARARLGHVVPLGPVGPAGHQQEGHARQPTDHPHVRSLSRGTRKVKSCGCVARQGVAQDATRRGRTMGMIRPARTA